MPNRYRYVILAAAVLMQACLGATYSWSIFVHALREAAPLRQATAQLPFTVFYTAFPATMIVSSLLLRRLGPRGCAMAGGLVFGGGWILAGLGRLHFAWTIVGVGLLGGIGVGLAYLVPIAMGMLWFPRSKGLVTGVSVAGFAGGAAMVASLASHTMTAYGTSPFYLFQAFGVAFAALVVAGGACMRYPAEHAESSPEPGLDRGFVRDRTFNTLYVAMFIGIAAGFAVNGNLRQLCPAAGPGAGAFAVAVFAVSNAGGRIAWGFVFDRLLSTRAIRINLACQGGLLLASPLLLRSATGLYCLAVLAGFNYGGVLVLYASATAHRWGGRRVGEIYGRLFSANIPASLVPLLAGAGFDMLGSFIPALVLIGTCLAVVAVFTPPDLESRSSEAVPIPAVAGQQ